MMISRLCYQEPIKREQGNSYVRSASIARNTALIPSDGTITRPSHMISTATVTAITNGNLLIYGS